MTQIAEIFKLAGDRPTRTKLGEVRMSPVDEVLLILPRQTAELVARITVFDKAGNLSIRDGQRWIDRLDEGIKGTYLWAEVRPAEEVMGRQAASNGSATMAADAYDPKQRRDPRTGQWIKVPGGAAEPQLAYDVRGGSDLADIADEAQEMLDKVARPEGEPVVEEMSAATLLDYQLRGQEVGGQFKLDGGLVGSLGPGLIEMNTTEDRNKLVGTLVHETAHWLDYNVNQDSRGQLIGTENTAQLRKRPKLKAVVDAISDSPTQQKFKQTIEEQAGTGSFDAMVAEYMSKPSEAFARAWTQYVMTEADTHPDAEAFRKDREAHQIEGSYWSEEEFKPIAAAMAAYIEDMGWKPASTT